MKKIKTIIALKEENYKWLNEQVKSGVSKTTIYNMLIDYMRYKKIDWLDMAMVLQKNENHSK